MSRKNKHLVAMHVCYLKPGNQNGYEIRVIEEARALRDLGVRVIIACFINRREPLSIKRLWGFYRSLRRSTRAKIYILPTSHYFDLSVPQNGIRSIVRPLIALAKLHKVNIMHGQALYSTMHILRMRQRTMAKVIFDVHGVSPEENEMSGASMGRVNRLTEWEQEALNTADLRIFVSNRMKGFFEQKYDLPDKPSILIPCAVHSEKFQMSEEIRLSKREEMGIEDKFVILYLGTLSAWQWPEAVFAVFAQFYRNQPDSLLYLLLPRSEHETAFSLAQRYSLPSESYMIQEVPHSDVGSVIGIADAGVLLRKSHPVNFVSSPTKFGEYLAAGIPLVSTPDIGDTSALIKSEKIGILISPTDEGIQLGELCRLLEFTDDVRENRAEWSRRCVQVARNLLEWDRFGETLFDAYGDMREMGHIMRNSGPVVESHERCKVTTHQRRD